MDAVTVRHDDELERDYGKWVLVRRSLGVHSFGINAVELQPGDSIPEHDERERAHEELFLVLEGTPTLVADGTEHALRPGLVRAPRARADPDGPQRRRLRGARPHRLGARDERLRAAGPGPERRRSAADVAHLDPRQLARALACGSPSTGRRGAAQTPRSPR